MTPPMDIFLSFAPVDTKWGKRFEEMLAPLLRGGGWLWHAGKIDPGEDRREVLRAAMDRAGVFVILVSATYLASSESQEELKLIRESSARGARIVPIIVSACLWQHESLLSGWTVIPRDGKPLEEIKSWKTALTNIVLSLSGPRADGDGRAGSSVSAPATHLGGLPRTGRDLFGRAADLQWLTRAWDDPRVHIAVLTAWGGVGKSALVNRWLADRAPDHGGAERVFGWSFYSQGVGEQKTISADLFLEEALRFFGDPEPARGHPFQRSERLARLARERRTLLILDGLEPLQDPHDGMVRDAGVRMLLGLLASDMNGLCVITTRPPFLELNGFPAASVQTLDLSTLAPEAGATLLGARGVQGERSELEQASRDFHGHPLALTLLGNYLTDALESDVRRRGEVQLLADGVPGVRHARSVMASYDRLFGARLEAEVLRLLGLFDRPADTAAVAALRNTPIIAGATELAATCTTADWNRALSHLRRTGLLAPWEVSRTLDTHPLVREYFGEALARQRPSGYRGAHARLFEHLQQQAPPQPKTLDQMQPLFQAMYHGCRAGLRKRTFEDVFWSRIRQGAVHYSYNVLGAIAADLAAMAGFFEGDWTRPAAELPTEMRALLLNEAGHGLVALGRTREALACLNAATETDESRRNWRAAAVSAGNWAEALIALGDLEEAHRVSLRAVQAADRARDPDECPSNRCYLGSVLHLLGRLNDSRRVFEEAERVQMDMTVGRPRLYSRSGAEYCDLLLEFGEVDVVAERVDFSRQHLARTKLRFKKADLLSDGLHELTSARVAAARGDVAATRRLFGEALAILRASGRQDYLTAALLRYAEFERERDKTAAQRSLEEALRIAHRAEFRLHLCDGAILTAALALDAGDDAGARNSVKEARRLYQETKYGLRADVIRQMESRLF